MENMFLKLLKEKMLIFKTKCLVYYFWRCKENIIVFSPIISKCLAKFLLIVEDQM
jgi:hypothetical protein